MMDNQNQKKTITNLTEHPNEGILQRPDGNGGWK